MGAADDQGLDLNYEERNVRSASPSQLTGLYAP